MQINKVIKSQNDNIIKLIFDDHSSGLPLEVSLIRKGDGKDIVCVPSQTNCKMGCQFCHLTGIDIPASNLHWNEICNLVNKTLEKYPSENSILLISYMGAGEPLLNVHNVICSMLGAQHWKSYYKTVRFAVSTIIPKLSTFGDFAHSVRQYDLPVKLHWSMHSTNYMQRKSLMPAAVPNEKAINALRHYKILTEQPVEIHYTLMDGVNDRNQDISAIEKLVDKDFTIKILRFAPRKNINIQESDRVEQFKNSLEQCGFKVEIYTPPGRDIQAACGQFILDQYVR